MVLGKLDLRPWLYDFEVFVCARVRVYTVTIHEVL
jgi:hypothetical protein